MSRWQWISNREARKCGAISAEKKVSTTRFWRDGDMVLHRIDRRKWAETENWTYSGITIKSVYTLRPSPCVQAERIGSFSVNTLSSDLFIASHPHM